MANTKQRQGELVRAVFQILLPHPDGLPVKDILHRLESLVPPTPYEIQPYPSRPEGRRYDVLVRFSTIGPVKAGWLSKTRGLWTLTDAGRDAFHNFSNPLTFIREADRLYRAWKTEQPNESSDVIEDSSPAAATLEEAEGAAWSQIEAHLLNMSPYDFQDLVAALLRGMGYHIDWISPPGPDRGIDIVAHADPLGVQGPRIKVQVKRRADKVAVDGVRGFMAIFGDSDVGLFVCTGGFTRDAEDEARRQERRRIMLLNLDRLVNLWTEHYANIPEPKRRLLPLRPIYYLAPPE